MKKTAVAIVAVLLIVSFYGCPPPRPTVVVDVCVETGLLPNPYCPIVAPRRYYAGSQPATVCAVHVAPADPIKKADTRAPRIGLDVYQLIAFPLADIKWYLEQLVENGGSGIRIFFNYTWGPDVSAGWRFAPFKLVGYWTDAGGQYDGQQFPLYSVAASDEYGDWANAEIWDKWTAIFNLCAERDIKITVSVLDGCSWKTPLDARRNPILSNVQHLGAEGAGTSGYVRIDGSQANGYGIHTGGYYGGFGGDNGTMKDYYAPLIARVAAKLKASGADYRIMPCNEFEIPVTEYADQTTQDAIARAWLKYWIDQLKANGVPNERIVLSIAGTHDRTRVTVPLVRGYPGVVEQFHGPNSDELLMRFINLFGTAGTEFDGDGFDPFANGYTNEFNYSMPSIVQAQGIRALLIQYAVPLFSIFNGYIEGLAWQDIRKADFPELRALSGR